MIPTTNGSFGKVLKQLSPYILLSNILFTVGPLLSRLLVPMYSYQTLLYLNSDHPLLYSLSFDGYHFMSNEYQWEINYAFLPGYVTFIKVFKLLLTVLFGEEQPVLLLVILIVLNKIFAAVSAVFLYKLSLKQFADESLAKASAIVFLFNPASIFYHVVYSQALYSCLTIIAIYLAISRQRQWQSQMQTPLKFISTNALSLVLFAISISIRSTGLFLILIYGIPILVYFFRSIPNIKAVLATGVIGLFIILCFISFYTLYLYYGYVTFCTDQPKSWFCDNTVPNIYSAVQQKFWQVGFLKYWNRYRTVFILFGLPSMICGLLCTIKSRLWFNQGLLYSYYILLFVTICYSNVQSSARFFSSHPVYSIMVAEFLSSSGHPKFGQKCVLFYFILYNIAGVVLFPIRFLWT